MSTFPNMETSSHKEKLWEKGLQIMIIIITYTELHAKLRIFSALIRQQW